MNEFNEILQNSLGISSENQNKIIISILVIIFLWLIRILIQRLVWKQTQNPKIRYNWKRDDEEFFQVTLVTSINIEGFPSCIDA